MEQSAKPIQNIKTLLSHGLLHNDIERGQKRESNGKEVNRQCRDVDRGAVGEV